MFNGFSLYLFERFKDDFCQIDSFRPLCDRYIDSVINTGNTYEGQVAQAMDENQKLKQKHSGAKAAKQGKKTLNLSEKASAAAKRKGSTTMTDIVIQCCEAMKDLLVEFRNFKKSRTLKDLIIRINDLEEKSDRLFVESIRGLFTEPNDLYRIIAWKDIYEYLEHCADACEHVADVVESVVMSNS